jgi:hypothetical protein
MDRQATKLEDAENNLKHLMDEVTRAMYKAQDAVMKITSNASAARTEKHSDGLQGAGP